MSINEISQKKNLLGKLGLGVPKMSSNIRISQQNPQPPAPRPPQSPPTPKPTEPVQPKPGCGGCRRKRPS